MPSKEKLIEIVGAENFTDQLEELVPYSYDASMNVHRPDAAVWPESTEQVAEIVKFANEYKIPVVPRGAGTSLSGGVIPIKGGIILDLSRMNRILEISIENRYARVQAGVVCDDLNRATGKTWFYLSSGPGEQHRCHHRRKCRHQRRWNQGSQIRHHPGLCPRPSGRFADGRGDAHGLLHDEMRLRL